MSDSNVAIQVRNIGKQYKIGERQADYKTIRETIVRATKAPFIRAGNLIRGEAYGAASLRKEIWALKDVSFDVMKGEVLGIIGRNGAGKTTLLKILSRITEPTEGRAEIHGRVSTLLEVGTGMHPELTGRENVYLNGAILGMQKEEINSRFEEIIEFSGVEQFIDTPLKHYSSGMQVRLAFAIASHLEPEILMIDEVLAVGDAEFQKKCLGKMKEVASSGRTVLFISHNMNAIEQLCDRCLNLKNGEVVHDGYDVRSIIRNYLFEREEAQAVSWTNSGDEFDNKWLKPTTFFLADAEGNTLQIPARNDTDMFVQLELDIKQTDIALQIGYAIYNEDGELLFWSDHTDTEESRWPRLTTGRNILRSQIPKHMLNEGTYLIELMASLYFREWIFEPGRGNPSIFLTIQGGLSDSPHWMARRPGIFAPVIEWVDPRRL